MYDELFGNEEPESRRSEFLRALRMQDAEDLEDTDEEHPEDEDEDEDLEDEDEEDGDDQDEDE